MAEGRLIIVRIRIRIRISIRMRINCGTGIGININTAADVLKTTDATSQSASGANISS